MDPRQIFDRRIAEFFASALRGSMRNAASSPRQDFSKALKLLRAGRYQRRQAARRATLEVEGVVVPPILIASLTRACNLDCAGCYAKTLRHGPSAELSEARFMEIFREALKLGVGTLMLAGGEPLLRRSLIEAAAGLEGPLIPVFTNGTLIDQDFARLAAQSSLVPVLSIEGESSFTAARRGEGVHEGALAAMELLKRQGALFGASITLTSRNAATVLSRDFLKSLGRRGISVLFLVEYVPVAPGTEDLVLEPEQKASLVAREVFKGLPYPVVALPGDEEAFGGCLAAGRGFIHVADDGRLEACPFAPYSDTGVAQRSLRAALDSPLMASIREHHGELVETRGGCSLWNKGGWVASLGTCAIGDRGAIDNHGTIGDRGASSDHGAGPDHGTAEDSNEGRGSGAAREPAEAGASWVGVALAIPRPL